MVKNRKIVDQAALIEGRMGIMQRLLTKSRVALNGGLAFFIGERGRVEMKKGYSKGILTLTFAVSMLITATAYQTEATTKYQVTDLGNWAALDINNVGQVAGGQSGLGVFWDPITGLKQTQGTPFYFYGGLNDSGQMVGSDGNGGPGHLWDTSTDQYYEIGILEGEGTIPNGINNSGQVVGHTYQMLIFIWDSVNGTQSLGFNGWGDDINDSGQVVGTEIIINEGRINDEAFIWDNLNGKYNIGTLGGDRSEALGINNIGQVVGKSRFISSSYAYHALLWDEVNGIKDLGTLGYRPPLEDNSQAYDINIHGEVVGRSSASSPTEGVGGWFGFIWDDFHGMRDLNELIPADSGWIIGNGFGINDSGQIVGYGYLEGEEGIRAFLLTPIPSKPTIDAILEFFDKSVANGTLEGRGKRPKIANFRLWLMGEMLESVKWFIEKEKIKAACAVENRSYKRSNGKPKPKDFVQGESAPQLADMIMELMCEQECKGCVK